MIFRHPYCYLPPSAFISIASVSPFSLQITCLLLFPLSIAQHPYDAMLPFAFLVSAVLPGYVLTCEYLEVGTSGEREHVVFVPLGLGYLTQCNLL